jgi:hypothetical protein
VIYKVFPLYFCFFEVFISGQYRIRTNDRLRVKQLRYRCANRP